MAVGRPAKGSSCVYPAPAALTGVNLPKLVVIAGPDGHRRLVGAERVGGAADADVVWVSPALLGAIAPGRSANEVVEATIKRASWWDIFVLMGREADRKVISATLTFVAAVAVAAVAFATSKVGVGVAVGLLILVCFAALYTFRNAIREAFTPKC